MDEHGNDKGRYHWRRGFSKIILNRTHGANGTKVSISMQYKLGKKTIKNLQSIAIIKNQLKRNLSKYSGIVFYIKSTEDILILFGMEDHEKNIKKEERWNRNIFVTRDWEKKRIPFKSLTLNRHRAERLKTNQILSLKQIESIYWVVHENNVKPGTKGKIWLDEISFY